MKIYIADCETFKGYSLFSFLDIETDTWYEFSINEYINQLDDLIVFFEDNKDAYFAFYNGIKFDCQITEYVIRNYEFLKVLSNLKIAYNIWQRSQDEIDNSNHDVWNTYKESEFSIKCIDLMEIPHFTNKNKRTSLKWLAFMLDVPSIEELPFEHFKADFTKEECEKVRLYCRKDIIDSYEWYKYLRGNTTHEIYSGRDKIAERLDLIETLEFPKTAISWNDVKIGDELNKRGYMSLTNKNSKDIYQLKKNRGATKKFTYGDAIPEYVKFQTPEFQAFYESVKNEKVSLIDKDKQKYPFEYKGTKYSIMRGGIHSSESNRIIIPKDNEILMDGDIGSQYPNSIIKRQLYPSHLGKEWLVNYENTIKKRIEFKEKGKTDLKYKGLSEMYKLSLNGGGFGKTNERSSWQYDPRVTYFCTIGNQFEILMLIEMLELKGIRCVSANTDGILCLYDKSLSNVYYETCHEWEKIVGNDKMGMLEYTEFSRIWQESVNHYIAVKKNGEVKIKGRFAYEVDLNKNNTDKIGRIERKAIVNYVTQDIPIEETIRNSTNIYDFCIGLKSSKNYHFQTFKDYKFQDYKKIVRFFISNNGSKLIKVKKEGSEATGADLTKISDGYLVTIFNDYYQVDNFSEYDINYDYYIKKCEEIVKKVEKGKKIKQQKYNNINQLDLF